MMKKTLGGDRLGAGKKMQVDLHGYERSTHDLSYLWRSSMASGTLVPFLSEVATPGDTFDIDLDCDVRTHPTIGPLFGSYKVQLDVFLAPFRLYNAQLHNNSLDVGRNMANIKIPQIRLSAVKFAITKDMDLDNSQINPSCIMKYLGVAGVGIVEDGSIGDTHSRSFNAIPLLAYWEIYKNYYANKQEGVGAVIHTPSVAIVNTLTALKWNGTTLPSSGSTTVIYANLGDPLELDFTGTQPLPSQIFYYTDIGWVSADTVASNWFLASTGVLKATYDNGALGIVQVYGWKYQDNSTVQTGKPALTTFTLGNIDDMRKYILTNWSNTVVNVDAANITPYVWLAQLPNGVPNTLSSQEGLAIKTYQSDLLNNWLNTTNIAAITSATNVDTSGGSFSIDTLNLSKKVYNLLNRINVSGGTYNDWLDAVYTHERFRGIESPMYMGGLSKELIFQAVVSNTGTEAQPLGTLAGQGRMGDKHKGGKIVIKIDEPSYILGIVSLTPRVDYSQGNKWDTTLATMDDLHKPALDEIGFQDLLTERMAWFDTGWKTGGVWTTRSAGKQPAWLNYMTNINRTYGNFAQQNNEMFMTLNRRYSRGDTDNRITDITTYIDPSKFNFVFAQTSLDSQNFWTQIAVNMIARRKMSAKIMPNL